MAMAALNFTPSPSFNLTKQTLISPSSFKLLSFKKFTDTSRPWNLNKKSFQIRSYKVVIEHEGETKEMEVEEDEDILSKALDIGLSVPHDCRLGVCMTCPAKLVSGTVDQSEGMLSDDVVERGYALLCASYPRSDCHIRTIPEEDLLALQLATAND